MHRLFKRSAAMVLAASLILGSSFASFADGPGDYVGENSTAAQTEDQPAEDGQAIHIIPDQTQEGESQAAEGQTSETQSSEGQAAETDGAQGTEASGEGGRNARRGSDQQTGAPIHETGAVYYGEYGALRTCSKVLYTLHFADQKIPGSSDTPDHQRKPERAAE